MYVEYNETIDMHLAGTVMVDGPLKLIIFSNLE